MYKTAIAKQARRAAYKFRPDLLKKDGELNVAALSRETKIKQPTLKRIFDGEIQQSKTDTLRSIATALKITLDSLIYDIEPVAKSNTRHRDTPQGAGVAEKIDLKYDTSLAGEDLDFSKLSVSELREAIIAALPLMPKEDKKKLVGLIISSL